MADVLLGAYAAKRCPVRIHNDFHPNVPKLPWTPGPDLQDRLDAGAAFEAELFDRLVDLHADDAHRVVARGGAAAMTETGSAMRDGVGLILGGQLPDDPTHGRKGRPDVLVRVTGRNSSARYVPAEVKHHATLKTGKRTRTTVSSLDEPWKPVEAGGLTEATPNRFADVMQLAHYTRMLQACGFHPGEDWSYGLTLGTSTHTLGTSDDVVFVWHDLRKKTFSTFSRAESKTRRSALERYDHEHDFRVKVARTAAAGTSLTGDDGLVIPLGQEECLTCPYQAWCDAAMGDDDASRAIVKGRLDVREWLTLRRLGVRTVSELASLDQSKDTFQSAYFSEVTQHTKAAAAKRLSLAVDRARMIRDGKHLQRTAAGPLHVPTADVEVDLDVEWDNSNRVYMWGVRVRNAQDEDSARYLCEFTSFDALDDDDEKELAVRFVQWLRSLISDEGAHGRKVLVFHWSHPEASQLKRILGSENVADLVGPDGVYVDLESFVGREFLAVSGTSIKKVAPALGFQWRVKDPGGAMSQTYLNDARGQDQTTAGPARDWLFTYNEDDCAAMAAVRDRLRERYEHQEVASRSEPEQG